MKKILILMVIAIMFIACGDNSVSPEPTYISSETVSYWSLEVGNVCNSYNIDDAINDKSKPVESYYAMQQICGDRANLTYKCEPVEQSVEHIMKLVKEQTALYIVDLAKNYGAAFGFYNEGDGYLRYVYFEQCYDGKALMKRQ